MRCGQSGQSGSILERVRATAVISAVLPTHRLDELERFLDHGLLSNCANKAIATV
jgi:hypothetical protein